MEINWEIVAAVGETLGGIGVIATLIYLSIEIRQNIVISTGDAKQSEWRNLALVQTEISPLR